MALTDTRIENMCTYMTAVLPLIDIFSLFLFRAISNGKAVLIPFISEFIYI